MTPRDFAWLAGIVEGEGCFYMINRCYIYVAVKMCDLDIIEECHRVAGVGWVAPISNPNRPSHHRPQFGWWVAKQPDVDDLLLRLYPYLGIRRRAKIDMLRERRTAGRIQRAAATAERGTQPRPAPRRRERFSGHSVFSIG